MLPSLYAVLDATHRAMPRCDLLNLIVDGSTQPQYINPETDYRFISRIIITLKFTSMMFSWNSFAGGSPLENGLQLSYNSHFITTPIKVNSDLMKYCYGSQMIGDSSIPPKTYVISSAWLFSDVVPFGLAMWYEQDFNIVIQDDITSYPSIVDFTACVQGWQVPK